MEVAMDTSELSSAANKDRIIDNYDATKNSLFYRDSTSGKRKDEGKISCFSGENALKALTGLIMFGLWVFMSWKKGNYDEPFFIEEAMLWGAILLIFFGLWIGYRNPLHAIPWIIIMRITGLALIFSPNIMTGQVSILSCLYGCLFFGVAYGLLFGVIIAVLAMIPYLIYRRIHNRV